MAMRKYADGEGPITPLEHHESKVVEEHLEKTGKSKLSDLDEKEREAFSSDLVQAQDEIARFDGGE